MRNLNESSSTRTLTDSSSNQSGPIDRNQENDSIARTLAVLFLYSAAMFTLPIGAYFGMRNVLLNEFGIGGFTNTIWSVVAAVVIVNLIIASYIVRAIREERRAGSKSIKTN